MDAPAVTTVIMTLNEELHIGRCVRSAASLGPVLVVDSGSSDRTVACAEEAGAVVVHHAWAGYGAQRAWALEQVAASDWVLVLDADEYLDPAVAGDIRAATTSGRFDAYYLKRRNYFLGRALMHAGRWPDLQLRLFRPGAVMFEERSVHERAIARDEPGILTHPIHHDNQSGIDHFLHRHAGYARLEAAEMAKAQEQGTARFSWFFGSRHQRRRALKELVWYRLPSRGSVRWFWLMVVNRGFLDGPEGRAYIRLLMTYEIMIDGFRAELAYRRRTEPAQAGILPEAHPPVAEDAAPDPAPGDVADVAQPTIADPVGEPRRL
jgi:glycosyltransferase involved in cell wall biosynthesis